MRKPWGSGKKPLAVVCAIVLGIALSGCSAIDPLAILSELLPGGPKQSDVATDGSEQRATSESEAKSPSAAGDDRDAPAQPSVTLCSDGTEPRSALLNGQRHSGVWVGDIVEPHGATYKVRAVLNDDGCDFSGTFEYHQGLNCSGTWSGARLVRVSGPNEPFELRVNFIELVDNDPAGACAPVAEVEITYGPGGLFYASEWLRNDGEATASRTLLQPE